MSLVPPKGTVLGALRIREVWFEHDGPKLFVVTSRSQRIYVAVMVAEDDESETYVYLPISFARFRVLRSGGLTLREAFSKPEEGSVFEVVADYATNQNTVRLIAAEDIPADYLPDQTAAVNIPTRTRPAFNSGTLAEESVSESRTLLALEIDPHSQLRTELSLRSLSRLAGGLQDTIDALAQERTGKPTPRGAIPGDVLRESELVFRTTAAASFVLIAGSATKDSLVDSPLLAEACTHFVSLLEKGTRPDELRELVNGYGPRVRAKYRSFLEALTDEETGVSAYAATPDGTTRSASLKPADIRFSLSLLREVGQEVLREYLEYVHLIGVNLRTGSFELLDPRNGTRYSGYMDNDARRLIEGLPTGTSHSYSAEVLVQQQFSNIINEVTKSYRLTAIGRPYEQDDAPVVLLRRSSSEENAT